MLELAAWMRRLELPARPWLIVGRGPTFACRGKLDLTGYHVLGLDHVAREMRVDVAVVLDVETVVACGENADKHCRWLVMPRRPEVNGQPGPPLESYFDRTPVLRRLAAQNRLVSYAPAAAPDHAAAAGGAQARSGRHGGSLEQAVDMLVQLNVRRVRSLGLDGGHACSEEFHDVEVRALKAIGHEPRGLPPREIEALFHVRGIDYGPLAEPMRVFAGGIQGNGDSLQVPARVLAFSIRQHASQPVVVDFLRDVQPPKARQLRHRLRSAASLRRFAIPELCGYRGRALCVEASSLVLGDVAELWNIPFGPQKILCTYYTPQRPTQKPGFSEAAGLLAARAPSLKPGRQLGVMLLDCARLHWDLAQLVRGLDERRYTHAQLVNELCPVEPDEIADTLPGEWNCPEGEKPGFSEEAGPPAAGLPDARLVHFAAPSHYPWKASGHPSSGLWMNAYRAAVAAGAIPLPEVTLGIASGHLKPELLTPFEELDPRGVAALRLDLPHRLKLVAAHRARKVMDHAKRLAGHTVRRLRSKTP